MTTTTTDANHLHAINELRLMHKVALNRLKANNQDAYRGQAEIEVFSKLITRLDNISTNQWLDMTADWATGIALRLVVSRTVISDAIMQLREDEEARAWALAARTLRTYAGKEDS